MNVKLILLRHGQSVWNKENLFTGWVDIPLSEEGVQEAFRAGEKISHIPIDVAYTSALVRAHMTLALALLRHGSKRVPQFLHSDGGLEQEWGVVHGEPSKKSLIPVFKSPALNERMYGDLQGLNKAETAKKYGADQVQLWRRSYDTCPPNGESLSMTAQRALPYFKDQIVPCLERGQNVLVSAHGNSLRAIVMHIEGLSKEEIIKREIPTGDPLIYSYSKGAFVKE